MARKLKIVFFETEGWQKKYLQRMLKKHQLTFFADDIDDKKLALVRDINVLAVFVGSLVSKSVMTALPKLQLITTMSTGFDHIDLKEVSKRKIKVTNVPFYGENTVAEHAMALLLSIAHKIHQSYERTNRGRFNFDGLTGFDLKGKTIGVIGTGHIGQHLIKMARGFDMKVIAYDKYPDKSVAKKQGFEYVPLGQLLRQADVISLHLPYMPSTHHLLNANNMKSIKKGAVLINTARGGLIDTKAMVAMLRSGRLSAVGLDVLEGEKDVKEEVEMLSKKWKAQDMRITIENHFLMHSENAIVTPHTAFNSKEAITRILDTTIENIESFAGNKKLQNQVKAKN